VHWSDAGASSLGQHGETTHTTSTTTPRQPLRRLGAILFGLVIAGSAAFGVQTLLAAPVIDCGDPILTCAIGGDPRCIECCQLGGSISGDCVSNERVCLCED
jgi:hypothetical protein